LKRGDPVPAVGECDGDETNPQAITDQDIAKDPYFNTPDDDVYDATQENEGNIFH
jgi:hypothetical protein